MELKDGGIINCLQEEYTTYQQLAEIAAAESQFWSGNGNPAVFLATSSLEQTMNTPEDICIIWKTGAQGFEFTPCEYPECDNAKPSSHEASSQTVRFNHEQWSQTKPTSTINNFTQTDTSNGHDQFTQTKGTFSECCSCGVFSLQDIPFSEKMKEEISKRMVADSLVKILECELATLRQTVMKEKNANMTLQADILGLKSELNQSNRIAVQYTTQCDNLEESLRGCRTVINSLEEQLSKTNYFKSGIDYMLEAKLAGSKAAQAQSRLEALQSELLQSRQETQSLLDRMNEHNRERREMVSSEVHTQLLAIADKRAMEAELEVTMLRDELQKGKVPKKHIRPMASQNRTRTNTPVVSIKTRTSFQTETPTTEPIKTPLFVNSSSDDSDWNENDTKRQSSASVKNITSVTQFPPPVPVKRGHTQAIPSRRFKPTVPNRKPALAPKPVLKFTNKSIHTLGNLDICAEQHEKGVSFEKTADYTVLQLIRKPRGPGGRRLPSRSQVVSA